MSESNKLVIKEVLNPSYVGMDKQAIECEVIFESDGAELEKMPYTASASDAEVHGIALWQGLMSGDFGAIQSQSEEESLVLAKAQAHAAINEWRDAEKSDESATVMVGEIRWDADPDSQASIEQKLMSGFIPPYWTDADNNPQAINEESLKQILAAIAQRDFAIHERQLAMKSLLSTLTSLEAVQGFDIGWPE